jgi:hypothetical protein
MGECEKSVVLWAEHQGTGTAFGGFPSGESRHLSSRDAILNPALIVDQPFSFSAYSVLLTTKAKMEVDSPINDKLTSISSIS